MIKTGISCLLLLSALTAAAQTLSKSYGEPGDSIIIAPETVPVQKVTEVSLSDSLENARSNRYKIDGLVAVVGKYVVLDSDIKKFRIDIQNRFENEDISDCDIVSHLMENKLFAHAALQDSTVFGNISDAQIESQVEQQLQQLEQQIGSMEKVLEYYRKDSEQEIREELFKVNKENHLAQAMQEKVMDEVEITPEEVRTFFNDIPEEERPKFNDEVELAQIIIKPKTPQEEIDKVVKQLNDIREDIVERGASFATKAVLYSQDATSSNGGKMTIARKDNFWDKDFKEIAYSLREGEVSMPFKSSFGYHIVKVDRVWGEKRDIRHIIIIPKETKTSLDKAQARADSIRTLIESGKMTFSEAALRFSENEETKGDGGRLINPETGDTRFEMTNIDPSMYNEVKRLKKGEISKTLSDQTRTGNIFYKLITVTGHYPEHIADYAKDYTKIKNLALQNKQMKAIKKWRKEEIDESYIKIGEEYKSCDFDDDWLKK